VLNTLLRGLWMISATQQVQAWSPQDPAALAAALRGLGDRHRRRVPVAIEGNRFGLGILGPGPLPIGVQFTGRLAGSGTVTTSGTTVVGGISGTRRARLTSWIVVLTGLVLVATTALVLAASAPDPAVRAVVVGATAVWAVVAVVVLHRQGMLHRDLLDLIGAAFPQGFSVDQGPY
jgi:hypothetical protein